MNTINEDRHYLDIAIESYLNQQGIEIELIISTVEDDPNIVYILKKYPACKVVVMPRKDHPISKGIKSPLGSFLQLNNGLKHMTGEWFTFASGNDFAYPNKCALEVECCDHMKRLICYSAYNYVHPDGSFRSLQSFQPYDRAKHQTGNFVADCSMVHVSIVRDFLPFKTELNNYAYWDLWLRVYESLGDVFVYNPVATWGYRQDENSMHVNRWKDPKKMAQAEIDKAKMLTLHPL